MRGWRHLAEVQIGSPSPGPRPALRQRRNDGGPSRLWQAFPKLRCFSPRISKESFLDYPLEVRHGDNPESFGDCVEFQMVTRVKNPKRPSPNFFATRASFWTRFRRHRAAP